MARAAQRIMDLFIVEFCFNDLVTDRASKNISDARGSPAISIGLEPLDIVFFIRPFGRLTGRDLPRTFPSDPMLMRYCTDSGEVIEQLRDSSLERGFTFNELDAIVRASGVFRLVRVFGALRINQEFSCDSWRMVPVLEAV